MDLKQFMVRRQTLKLYRDMLKTICKIEKEEDRLYIKEWVRSDFRSNKNVTDDLAVKALISYGERSLKELEKNLNLCK